MRRLIAPILMGFGIAAFSFAPLRASAATAVQPGNAAAIRTYARVLRKINPRMPGWQSQALATHLLINAKRWKVDANILVALVSVESAWRTHARSWVGALGLGQLMPGTAAVLHVDASDPYQNLQGAARYLGGLLQRYHNNPHRYALAFAAYNAGPRAVAAYGGIPPYAETQNYVVKVMSAWHRLQRIVHIPAQPHRVMLAGAGSSDVSYWTAVSQQQR
jgi:soluble lytic murein transglycosylase-like protein